MDQPPRFLRRACLRSGGICIWAGTRLVVAPHDLVSPAVAKEWEVSRSVTLDRSDLWPNFRPTKVSLHGVSAAVAFGDAGLALEAARPSCDGTFPVMFRGPAMGPLVSGSGMTVSPCRRHDLGVVSAGPGGAVGDADERSGHRPVRRNAGQSAGGRSA